MTEMVFLSEEEIDAETGVTLVQTGMWLSPRWRRWEYTEDFARSGGSADVAW
jgi:hypothetical protein